MADVPTAVSSMMDSSVPEEPEDYTDWELDTETDQHITRLQADDQNTDEDWDLRGDGSSWEDNDART